MTLIRFYLFVWRASSSSWVSCTCEDTAHNIITTATILIFFIAIGRSPDFQKFRHALHSKSFVQRHSNNRPCNYPETSPKNQTRRTCTTRSSLHPQLGHYNIHSQSSDKLTSDKSQYHHWQPSHKIECNNHDKEL